MRRQRSHLDSGSNPAGLCEVAHDEIDVVLEVVSPDVVPVTSAPSDGGGCVKGVDSCSPSGASPAPSRGLLVLLAVLVEERGLVVVFLVIVFVIFFLVVFLIISVIVV